MARALMLTALTLSLAGVSYPARAEKLSIKQRLNPVDAIKARQEFKAWLKEQSKEHPELAERYRQQSKGTNTLRGIGAFNVVVSALTGAAAVATGDPVFAASSTVSGTAGIASFAASSHINGKARRRTIELAKSKNIPVPPRVERRFGR